MFLCGQNSSKPAIREWCFIPPFPKNGDDSDDRLLGCGWPQPLFHKKLEKNGHPRPWKKNQCRIVHWKNFKKTMVYGEYKCMYIYIVYRVTEGPHLADISVFLWVIYIYIFLLFRDLTKYGVWRPWLVTVLIFHVTQSPNKIMWIYIYMSSPTDAYIFGNNPHIPGPSPTPAKWLQSFLPARASNSVVHLLKSPPRLSKEFECQGSHSDLHKQNIVTDWNLGYASVLVIFFPCALRMPPKNRRYTHTDEYSELPSGELT